MIQYPSVELASDNTDTFALSIANEFSRRLYKLDGGEHMPKAIADNKLNPSGICATHDFCDPNMLMEEAFIQILGREPHISAGPDAPDSRLWNTAWGIARYNNFQIK